MWPKSDRDTGYGSRDALLRERRPREARVDPRDARDSRDLEYWKRDGHKTPEVWEYRGPERTQSPFRGRARTPVRDHRMPRVRSPDRQEYLRAKSMHDLTQRRPGVVEDERRGRDPRRRSLYDPAEEVPYEGRRPFASHTHLQAPASPGTSSSSSPSRPGAGGTYHELPDHQRHPGLDRATARVDHLDPRSSKRTFDYPVNGGHAAIHITRAHHDDYRKFRYDHGSVQFVRASAVPAAHF